MQPTRMVTKFDKLKLMEQFGVSKSDIVKRYAKEHGLKVVDVKIFHQEERDRRDGYEDATTDRDARENASLEYRAGFLDGKIAKVDWAIQDLRDLAIKMRDK